MKSSFSIRHFGDYHEIYSKTFNTIELGCFPVNDYGCCRYFGLFYKGRKPSLKKVMSSIKKKVDFGQEVLHYRSGDDVGISLSDLEYEVKEALKSEPTTPEDY